MDNIKYLDEFGKKIVNLLYNNKLKEKKRLITNYELCKENNKFCCLLERMSTRDKEILFNYFLDDAERNIHDLMAFFEENDNIKIMYNNDNEFLNLKELSHQVGIAGFLNGEAIDWVEDYGMSKFDDK